MSAANTSNTFHSPPADLLSEEQKAERNIPMDTIGTLVGNLTRDPELRYAPAAVAAAHPHAEEPY